VLKVQGIAEFLTSCGGSALLGKVTSQFEGVKKAQLAEHFFLLGPASDPVVSVGPSIEPGMSWPATQRGQDDTASRKKRKKLLDQSAATHAPLGAQVVQRITDHLQRNGGSMPLGKLVSMVEGLKKVQVEQHFYVFPIDGPQAGNYVVSMTPPTNLATPAFAVHAATFIQEPAGETFGAKKKKRKVSMDPNAPPPLDSQTIEQISDFLVLNGGTTLLGKLTSAFSGLRKAQLEPHFALFQAGTGDGEWSVSLSQELASFSQQSAEGVMLNAAGTEKATKARRERKMRDPDAPPPPDLDEATVQRITSFLQQEGGSASLGKVSTVFEGVKKVQLEARFQVASVDGGSNCIVSAEV